MREPTLRVIAQELVTVVKSNISVDWMHRDSARANIRRHVKRLLRGNTDFRRNDRHIFASRNRRGRPTPHPNSTDRANQAQRVDAWRHSRSRARACFFQHRSKERDQSCARPLARSGSTGGRAQCSTTTAPSEFVAPARWRKRTPRRRPLRARRMGGACYGRGACTDLGTFNSRALSAQRRQPH